MSKRAKVIVAALVAAVVGLMAFAGIALAADPNPGVTNPNGNVQWGCGYGNGFGPVWSDTVTKLLGLTTEQIQAERQAGKSLVQIAASKGVTEDALVAAIIAPRKELIKQRVQAGTLTQAQADEALKWMEQNMRQAVKSTTIGPPEGRGNWGGGRGGFGMGPGMMGWNTQGNQGTTNTPAGPGMMRGWGRGIR